MTDPMLVLPTYTWTDGRGTLSQRPSRTIRDCKWRIRTFVERDAYVRYDFAGQLLAKKTLTRNHVYLMNSAMGARSHVGAWTLFSIKSFPILTLFLKM